MFTLITHGTVYAPEHLGKKDVLLAAGTIAQIDDHIDPNSSLRNLQMIDAEGKYVVPGFIDPHVHILGGGGEGGFKTRTPESQFVDIIKSGITTVVGCLGTDGYGRNLVSLLAKARALQEEGISTYVYTGSYQLPVTTITGSVQHDILLINEFIGVGEIAISDHRSSQPTVQELAKLAAEARVGGMLSGKAGIVNIHIGDGKSRLSFLEHIVETTEIPITQLYPTHIGRNPQVFEEGIEYAKKGGYVDFTTSTTPLFAEEGETTAGKALNILLQRGVSSDNITFSSDAQGSLPAFNEQGEYIGLDVGKCDSLFNEVRTAILDEQVDMAIALKVITANPATILKLPAKGAVKEGYDADVVLLDQGRLDIDTVIARGVPMILHKDVLHHGTFPS